MLTFSSLTKPYKSSKEYIKIDLLLLSAYLIFLVPIFSFKTFNSSLVTLSNLGSFVDAAIAFLIISSAIEFVVGKNVPIQPLNSPNLWIDTNTPALFFVISSLAVFGTSITSFFKILK